MFRNRTRLRLMTLYESRRRRSEHAFRYHSNKKVIIMSDGGTGDLMACYTLARGHPPVQIVRARADHRERTGPPAWLRAGCTRRWQSGPAAAWRCCCTRHRSRRWLLRQCWSRRCRRRPTRRTEPVTRSRCPAHKRGDFTSCQQGTPQRRCLLTLNECDIVVANEGSTHAAAECFRCT